jgi:hypothetical protein
MGSFDEGFRETGLKDETAKSGEWCQGQIERPIDGCARLSRICSWHHFWSARLGLGSSATDPPFRTMAISGQYIRGADATDLVNHGLLVPDATLPWTIANESRQGMRIHR